MMRTFVATLASCIFVCVLGSTAGANGGGEGGGAMPLSVCATGSVLRGVDVSELQGTVDWPTAKAAGIAFAFARLSDGTTHSDPQFDANWAGMKSAGVVRGAYQFFEPGQDPIAQASLVVQKLGMLATDDLPVVADVEVSGGQSPATVVSNLQAWVSQVRAGTGKTPIIYTSPGLWSSIAGSTAFGAQPLWVANWGVACPTLPMGWSAWRFWQYADNGTVAGIPATVDLDEFNGDLTALRAFASGGSDWGATFVSQSWPVAPMTMTMTVNQVVPATITLRNSGKKTWDTNTRLATTQPRDRTSAFAGADWIAPNRPAAVTGTVAPMQTFDFSFRFHAPSTPGVYSEYFGVIEEGAAWFSDPGQGGPSDDMIEADIHVVEAQYHGQFVAQTFPTIQQPALTMTTGQTLSGTIELKNVGSSTWKAGVTKLAPTPRDRLSPIGGSGWLSATRVSSPPADVPPGQSFAFPVQLTAGAPGDYTQTFTLTEDGVTWFADAPLGGGPPDDAIAIHVIVSAPDGGATDAGDDGSTMDGGLLDAGGLGADAGSATQDAAARPGEDAGPSGDGVSVGGGCAIAKGPESGARDGTMLLAVAVALARRRRARSGR